MSNLESLTGKRSFAQLPGADMAIEIFDSAQRASQTMEADHISFLAAADQRCRGGIHEQKFSRMLTLLSSIQVTTELLSQTPDGIPPYITDLWQTTQDETYQRYCTDEELLLSLALVQFALRAEVLQRPTQEGISFEGRRKQLIRDAAAAFLQKDYRTAQQKEDDILTLEQKNTSETVLMSQKDLSSSAQDLTEATLRHKARPHVYEREGFNIFIDKTELLAYYFSPSTHPTPLDSMGSAGIVQQERDHGYILQTYRHLNPHDPDITLVEQLLSHTDYDEPRNLRENLIKELTSDMWLELRLETLVPQLVQGRELVNEYEHACLQYFLTDSEARKDFSGLQPYPKNIILSLLPSTPESYEFGKGFDLMSSLMKFKYGLVRSEGYGVAAIRTMPEIDRRTPLYSMVTSDLMAHEMMYKFLSASEAFDKAHDEYGFPGFFEGLMHHAYGAATAFHGQPSEKEPYSRYVERALQNLRTASYDTTPSNHSLYAEIIAPRRTNTKEAEIDHSAENYLFRLGAKVLADKDGYLPADLFRRDQHPIPVSTMTSNDALNGQKQTYMACIGVGQYTLMKLMWEHREIFDLPVPAEEQRIDYPDDWKKQPPMYPLLNLIATKFGLTVSYPSYKEYTQAAKRDTSLAAFAQRKNTTSF